MAMSSYVSWSLVALCFALGVVGGSISNSFAVFVPSLQSTFDASRGAITVIYSFTFSGERRRWVNCGVARRSSRPPCAHAHRHFGHSTRARKRFICDGGLAALSRAWASPGPRRRLARGRVDLVIAWPLVSSTTPRSRDRSGLVYLRRRRHDRPPARPTPNHDGGLATRVPRLCSCRCSLDPIAAFTALASH
jgi:hypothetical protein